jgi:phosphocarrier protein
MIRREVTICNELGLHARAASRLVDCANRFNSHIEVSYRERTINGKSIMGVLMLAAACGATICLQAEGADQEQALEALVALVEDGFGENAP